MLLSFLRSPSSTPLLPGQITLCTIDEEHHIRSEPTTFALPSFPPTLFGAFCFHGRVRRIYEFFIYKFYGLLVVGGGEFYSIVVRSSGLFVACGFHLVVKFFFFSLAV